LLAPGYQSLRRRLAEARRRVTFKRHVIHVFLQLDDPYSYLLSHYLPSLVETYDIELQVYLMQALPGAYMPQPAMLTEYAIRDCRLMARELGVAFLGSGDAPVAEHRRALLGFLAQRQGQNDFVDTMHLALGAYWRGDSERAVDLIGQSPPVTGKPDALIATNQRLLRKLGHFGSAMMFYAGEWYWGVDRLMFLCTRLDVLRARRDNESEQAAELVALSQVSKPNLPRTVPENANQLPPVQMYFSFRSPYSYLGLPRILSIADAFGVSLDLRPVLPMVMRGLPVPTRKALYIIKDAAREARRLDIPFGNFCDPIGAGAERCIAVFFHAESRQKEREFVLSAGRAIWSEGIDVATDEGMRVVIERIGLRWPDVIKAMADDCWRELTEDNSESLNAAGLWGVPGFVMDDVALWGQDREWLVARLLEHRCRVAAKS